eukprot:g410.t1
MAHRRKNTFLQDEMSPADIVAACKEMEAGKQAPNGLLPPKAKPPVALDGFAAPTPSAVNETVKLHFPAAPATDEYLMAKMSSLTISSASPPLPPFFSKEAQKARSAAKKKKKTRAGRQPEAIFDQVKEKIEERGWNSLLSVAEAFRPVSEQHDGHVVLCLAESAPSDLGLEEPMSSSPLEPVDLLRICLALIELPHLGVKEAHPWLEQALELRQQLVLKLGRFCLDSELPDESSIFRTEEHFPDLCSLASALLGTLLSLRRFSEPAPPANAWEEPHFGEVFDDDMWTYTETIYVLINEVLMAQEDGLADHLWAESIDRQFIDRMFSRLLSPDDRERDLVTDFAIPSVLTERSLWNAACLRPLLVQALHQLLELLWGVAMAMGIDVGGSFRTEQ